MTSLSANAAATTTMLPLLIYSVDLGTVIYDYE
jgi:hypothetical protein